MMKFLVIRFSSIGDIVLTSPVVRCLKKQVKDAEIHFLTKYQYRHIVESNPYITKVHLLKESWHNGILQQLEAEAFDYIIDLHKNLRSNKIKRLLYKAISFSFNKLNWEKWLLTNLKINNLPSVHIVDRYMDAVKSLGIVNDGMGLDYFIPANEQVKENDIPTSHLAGYIGIVIGASYSTKKLPIEKLQELCTMIDYPLMLLGGPEDKNNGEIIASIDSCKIYNACGKFTLNESADLVRRSKLIISHDTGLMHIAAAFKKTVLSIWGNTVPAFGMYPYYGKFNISSKIFEVDNLRCRPCSKLGYEKCPRKHFKCMRDIDLYSIAEIIKKINKK